MRQPYLSAFSSASLVCAFLGVPGVYGQDGRDRPASVLAVQALVRGGMGGTGGRVREPGCHSHPPRRVAVHTHTYAPHTTQCRHRDARRPRAGLTPNTHGTSPTCRGQTRWAAAARSRAGRKLIHPPKPTSGWWPRAPRPRGCRGLRGTRSTRSTRRAHSTCVRGQGQERVRQRPRPVPSSGPPSSLHPPTPPPPLHGAPPVYFPCHMRPTQRLDISIPSVY
jgi:hypothetical protein